MIGRGYGGQADQELTNGGREAWIDPTEKGFATALAYGHVPHWR